MTQRCVPKIRIVGQFLWSLASFNIFLNRGKNTKSKKKKTLELSNMIFSKNKKCVSRIMSRSPYRPQALRISKLSSPSGGSGGWGVESQTLLGPNLDGARWNPKFYQCLWQFYTVNVVIFARSLFSRFCLLERTGDLTFAISDFFLFILSKF